MISSKNHSPQRAAWQSPLWSGYRIKAQIQILLKTNPWGFWQENRFGRRWREGANMEADGNPQTPCPPFLPIPPSSPGASSTGIIKTEFPLQGLFSQGYLDSESLQRSMSQVFVHFHTPHSGSLGFLLSRTCHLFSPASLLHVPLHSNHVNQHLLNICC